jgi:hypothetical protein
MGRKTTVFRGAAFAAAFIGLAACGDGPSEPGIEIALVTGQYTLTTLSFDPQGSLPDTNILPAIGTAPTLTLTADRNAQVVYRDPATNLFVTVNGTFRTTPFGVRLDFEAGSGYRQLLLSRRMDLDFNQNTGTLSFTGTAPDGVQRARLIALVPGFADEQLLDPVPGTLRVVFTRT